MQFLLVVVGLCMSVSHVMSTDVKNNVNGNIVSATTKPEMFYVEPSGQPQTNYIPVQIIPKPVFLHQQPHAMVIIAQPTYVPQNVLYGNPGTMQQQLLNYFHGNPKAKYQLLYGAPPQPTPQPYITQNTVGSPTLASYDVLPQPVFSNYQGPPTQFTYGQPIPVSGNPYPQPMQLNQLAQIAQSTAQQFSSPIRSVPPIITGFENFTPEQQIQIKAQLRAQLGAPLATTATVPATTTQPSQKQTDTAQIQEKNSDGSTGFTPSVMYRSQQFTKG